MMKVSGYIVFATLFCLMLITIAHAEIYTMATLVCDETKVFLNELTNKYHEQEVAGSVDGNGNLVRLFKSDKTWTLLRSTPSGISCTLDAGQNWETLIPGNKI